MFSENEIPDSFSQEGLKYPKFNPQNILTS